MRVSSDPLQIGADGDRHRGRTAADVFGLPKDRYRRSLRPPGVHGQAVRDRNGRTRHLGGDPDPRRGDRHRVVKGKSGSVRVDLGGRRSIKTTPTNYENKTGTRHTNGN